MDKFFLKAWRDALTDAFKIGFESAKDGPKISSFCFEESMQTDLALKRALDDILGSDIGK